MAASIVGTPPPAWATPAEKLAAARQAFQLQQYEAAAEKLNDLLYPEPQLSRDSDLIEAQLLLGIAHFEMGNDKRAVKEIDAVLARVDLLEELESLDPRVFSRRAIEFVERRRVVVIERARRDREAQKEAEDRERLRKLLENTIVIERRPYFINFMPLGAGQFQNGHRGKGVALAVSQVLSGGSSLGVFLWQLGKYGFNGVVPREEADSVRRLQQIQIVTGAIFLALYGAGIVDSLIHYKSATRVPADPSLLPNNLKPAPETAPDAEHAERPPLDPPTSFRILPTADPTGCGLVVIWEF